MIFIAAVFDFLDGFAARILNVKSAIGKELDSLADMVTFGVLPGIILYKLMILNDYFYSNEEEVLLPFLGNWMEVGYFDTNLVTFNWLACIAFLIPVFSALRLAKFNIDDRQTDSFIGLPTPANALFIAALPLLIQSEIKGFRLIDFFPARAMADYTYVGLAVVMSLLLVSNIPMFSLKVKNLSWKDNQIRFVFLALCLVIIACTLLIKFWVLAIPIIILLYIVLSIIDAYILKRNEIQSRD
jgi:CDP-diacylglycerol--serine O-phosphatidyltransferase